jgi:thiamine transport system ATP-binding protein
MLGLRDVAVRFGDRMAVDHVSLNVQDGEQLSVLGPSGSGKSTLLRAVAGLEPLASGRVEWDGQDVSSVPAHRRGFGLMFQDYVLFPHLDVAGNVGFGLQSGRPGAAVTSERSRRVAEVLELVGLSGFEKRMPSQLSGGEQQRVALARALAPRPRLLMLDEPLGALDRNLRRTLLDELIDIFERLTMPLLYVTHDHEEALAVADRVAVMRAGRLETVKPPAELWQSPPTEFVARFLGFANLLAAEVADGRAQTEIGVFDIGVGAPGRGRLLLRPDAFRPASRGNLNGVVHARTFRGDHTLLRVDLAPADGSTAATRLEVEWRWSPIPAVGDRVSLTVDPYGLVFLPLDVELPA